MSTLLKSTGKNTSEFAFYRYLAFNVYKTCEFMNIAASVSLSKASLAF